LTLVNFGYSGLDVSLESVQAIGATVQNYWLGSLIAFDHVVHHPNDLVSTQHPNRFFLETANAFGASFHIPSVHAAYTMVGPGQDTNTYTSYFSYFKDFGWYGIVVSMALVGALTTFVYRHAQCGPIYMAFSASFAVAILFTVHSERFVLGLNEYIKMLLFFWFTYELFPRLEQWMRGYWALATHRNIG